MVPAGPRDPGDERPDQVHLLELGKIVAQERKAHGEYIAVRRCGLQRSVQPVPPALAKLDAESMRIGITKQVINRSPKSSLNR